MNLRLPVAFLLLLTPGAFADTILVDANNGPGTDFVELQPAIDEAVAGDVIQILPGTYRSFRLTKGVTLLGQIGVLAGADSIVSDVPAGEVAVLSNLHIDGSMDVTNCAGSVFFDLVILAANGPITGPGDEWVLDVTGSTDVRSRQFGVNPGIGSGRGGVRVINSRFECDGGVFDGSRGVAGTSLTPNGGAGGIGLLCGPGSNVHIAFSRMRGGDGGDALFSPGAGHLGGDGGLGVLVENGGVFRFDGNIQNEIDGGRAGPGADGLFGDCAVFGAAGVGLQTGTALDPGGIASVTDTIRIDGGLHFCGTRGNPTANFGGVQSRPVLDVALHIEQFFAPQIGFETHGKPGSFAVVSFGFEPEITPMVGIVTPLLTTPFFTKFQGFIGPGGMKSFRVTPMGPLPFGELLIVQSATLEPDQTIHFSNSSSFVLF